MRVQAIVIGLFVILLIKINQINAFNDLVFDDIPITKIAILKSSNYIRLELYHRYIRLLGSGDCHWWLYLRSHFT
jgi:hypothetical protein